MTTLFRTITLIPAVLLLAAACGKPAPDQPGSDTPGKETYEAVTGSATDVDAGSAVLSGSVSTTAKDLSGITAGVVFSTSASLSGGKELRAAVFGVGNSFSVKASDLSAATTYYFAAFVSSGGSYFYGETKSFTTSSIPVSAVTLDRETLTLPLSAGSVRLQATVSPADATAPVLVWNSSAPSVATVSDGLVTPVGAGKATVSVTAGDFSASCDVSVYDFHAVDLGLGVKWADTNLGAFTEDDPGDFFAWGETAPKVGYSWSSYKWGTSGSGPFERYNTSSAYGRVDGRTVLLPEDDAATACWGAEWRMPDFDEMEQLRKSCTWVWDAGRKGYTVTGANGNSIFLPAAGYRIGGSYYGNGSMGRYWTSSLREKSPDSAFILSFDDKRANWESENRLCGLSIRPVRP